MILPIVLAFMLRGKILFYKYMFATGGTPLKARESLFRYSPRIVSATRLPLDPQQG
jgi:hypothetical protein